MIRVAVSGIPRGYQFPRSDGNWLLDRHREKILAVSPDVKLLELPETAVHGMKIVEEIEIRARQRVAKFLGLTFP